MWLLQRASASGQDQTPQDHHHAWHYCSDSLELPRRQSLPDLMSAAVGTAESLPMLLPGLTSCSLVICNNNNCTYIGQLMTSQVSMACTASPVCAVARTPGQHAIVYARQIIQPVCKVISTSMVHPDMTKQDQHIIHMFCVHTLQSRNPGC